MPKILLAQTTLAHRLLIGGLFGAVLFVYAPIILYMVQHWRIDSNYSHGFLIVPLAIYFIWERKEDLLNTPVHPSWTGVIPLLLSVVTLAIGRLGVELMNMRISLVLMLIGMVLLSLGREVFKVIWFPLFFLFLMIPLPETIVNIISFPLQLIAADMAVDFLYFIHIPSLREGNIIQLAQTQLFVAEACSGLRSLMALITLGVIFAYFFRDNWTQRFIIVLSAIPIAIFVNAFRVALTGILAHHYGNAAIEGPLHDFQGIFTFGIAFILLLGEAKFLQAIWPAPSALNKAGGPAL